MLRYKLATVEPGTEMERSETGQLIQAVRNLSFFILFVCLFVCLFGFNVAFNIICHITTVSGCDRELNAHFYSAASLWYQIPDTFI